METTASLGLRNTAFPAALRSGIVPQARARSAHWLDLDAPSALPGGLETLLRVALDHLGFGLMIVGGQSSVVYANAVARRECDRGDALCIDGDRLSAGASRQCDELLRALSGARRGRWSLVRIGSGDERVSLAILPLTEDTAEANGTALVVFGPRGRCRDLALEFYARSCGLTLAETRVLRALADGMTVREIAEQHEVKITTVRTQVSSIRERTHTRSVIDLVRTLSALPPIMAAMGHGL